MVRMRSRIETSVITNLVHRPNTEIGIGNRLYLFTYCSDNKTHRHRVDGNSGRRIEISFEFARHIVKRETSGNVAKTRSLSRPKTFPSLLQSILSRRKKEILS